MAERAFFLIFLAVVLTVIFISLIKSNSSLRRFAAGSGNNFSNRMKTKFPVLKYHFRLPLIEDMY
ncbi:hypothetical protein C6Y45_02485 [Alkalicoccus saliphilus]|uniref:Uncharacterized protein n=1 Tax=Alkalicoccus saliphilus TaxID=200989 RepID=A0A2T4UA49_9BACI|nr:hypothetical protein C6Y45_02485 [Alkalicoccus saliphilus]